MQVPVKDVEIVAPNFKRRLSGVTSTIVVLVPLQRRLGIKIAAFGPGLPATLPHIVLRDFLGFWKRPRSSVPNRVWHARRNVEMLAGIFMRDVLRMRLKLLFTSASQRHHKRFTKWLIQRMDGVIATSRKTAAYLDVPNTVIMHGIDLTQFRPPSEPEDFLSASDIDGKFAIGCFGRVRHQKGTDLFVDSMIALLPKYPDWVAVVAGRATTEHQAFERALRDKVKKAGLSNRIVFLGEVAFTGEGESIPVWYRRLTVYVAPSRREGFGLTPLEAMASQTAVVASDAGAYPELIVEGQTGHVVPAGDLQAMQDAIEAYLQNPDIALAHGRQALTHTRQNFPLEGEAEKIGALYNELLKNNVV
ncbi:glycosyltransferase family 4 protein [Ochrobactrum sp. CM-21-5]|nr:glycosyltransferase family 4 protein [Ochrobactrum sp. CM-21-5]